REKLVEILERMRDAVFGGEVLRMRSGGREDRKKLGVLDALKGLGVDGGDELRAHQADSYCFHRFSFRGWIVTPFTIGLTRPRDPGTSGVRPRRRDMKSPTIWPKTTARS